jgi:hypothetical protein
MAVGAFSFFLIFFGTRTPINLYHIVEYLENEQFIFIYVIYVKMVWDLLRLRNSSCYLSTPKYIIAAILLELRLHYLNCGWISLQFGISVQQNFEVLTLDSILSSLRCHDDDYWRNGLFRFGDDLSLYYGIHGVAPRQWGWLFMFFYQPLFRID